MGVAEWEGDRNPKALYAGKWIPTQRQADCAKAAVKAITGFDVAQYPALVEVI